MGASAKLRDLRERSSRKNIIINCQNELGLCFGAQNGPRPDIEITCTSASELDPKFIVGQQRANEVANRNYLLEANFSEFQRNSPNLEYFEADCHGSLRSASMVAIMVHWVQPVRLLVGRAFARTVRVPRQGQSTTAQPVHALLGICFNFAVQQNLPTLQLHPCILTRFALRTTRSQTGIEFDGQGHAPSHTAGQTSQSCAELLHSGSL